MTMDGVRGSPVWYIVIVVRHCLLCSCLGLYKRVYAAGLAQEESGEDNQWEHCFRKQT